MSRACAVALAICGLVSACQLDSRVNVPTKLVIDIDAELPVRLRSEQLQVLVLRTDPLAGTEPLLEHEFLPGTTSDGGWPVRIELVPEPADAQSQFSLTATAFDASHAYVAEARVQSGYVANEVHYVRLLLSAACMNVKCPDAQSCDGGSCGPAFRDPAKLPLFPTGAAAGEGALSGSVRADAGSPDSLGVGTARPDPCLVNNGGCDARVRCENVGGKAKCGSCPAGFEDPARDGTRCVDIDECKLGTAGCDAAHGRCTNTPGGRDCACADGYHGDGMTCSLNVTCTADSACGPQGQCREMAGGPRVCVCKPGFEGDGVACKDVDECARKLDGCRANAQCQNSEGSFSCPCGKGFVETSGACVDVDECSARLDDCDHEPNACVNTSGSFTCTCPVGYAGAGRGSAGCVDIDECVSGMACDAKRACVNTPGGFSCGACDKGYMQSGMRGCVDIDECAANNGGCDARRNCINTDGSSMCGACQSGFVPSGATGCANVNECGQNNGGCDSKRRCVESAGGGHSCGACDPGWLPSGATGCADIDECQVGNGGCDVNRQCVNTPGAWSCGDCKAGFRRSGSLDCSDVNECATNNGGCGAHRQCVNSEGSFSCGACDTGYMLSGNSCVDVNECSVNDGGCVHRPCTNRDGGFTCGKCDDGYVASSPTMCVEDPCAMKSCGVGGMCMNMNGMAVCSCDGMHVLDGGVCKLPCDVLPGPCKEGEKCTNSGSKADCSMCAEGYVKRPNGNGCILDPCSSNPCGPGGTCSVGNNGSASCKCPMGKKEQNGMCVDADPCEAVRCPVGSSCVASGAQARCVCADGTTVPMDGMCLMSPP